MSACRKWNEKEEVGKPWDKFKIQFAAAHHQHKKIQVESAA
jgi:hypothetical protein